MTNTLRFGIDRVVGGDAQGFPRRRLGVITNDAAVTACAPRPLMPSREALLRAGCEIVTLFSPEHGLAAGAADGVPVPDAVDPFTGLPVRSLYGPDRAFRPTREALAGVEALVYDLPDVGARFYTYIWTLSFALEACAEFGIPLWVLDRPNPLGGDLSDAEGPMFDESVQASFVGRWSMPVRHGLTLGELARVWNAERGLRADLSVVAVEGWDGRSKWPSLGTPFVPPSPAMPSYDTAVLYPGMGLLEGLSVSEGRGTALPFRVAGAPWIDGHRLAEAFNALEPRGAEARPVFFTPNSGRHAQQTCSGAMIHVTDELTFRPVATGLRLIALIWALHPEACAWAPYRTAANVTGASHFDRLVGRSDIRPALERPSAEIANQIAAWTRPHGWAARVESHLLYRAHSAR